MFNPVSWFIGFPPELATFLLSALPLTELRASIPIGIEIYKLPIWEVFLLAIAGNMAPVGLLLFFIPKLHQYIIQRKLLGTLFTKLLNNAEKKFSGDFAKYGIIGLAVFVGIPLPMTGAWTGALAAFVFNIPFKKAFASIFAGVVMAGIAVTLITLSAGGVWRSIF